MILGLAQTAADTAPLTFWGVILAFGAIALIYLAVSLPEIVREWRHAGRVIDRMPLPEQRGAIPAQRQERIR